jgi:site-specific DNA-cytosine methylase
MSADELMVFEAVGGVGGARCALDVLCVVAASCVNSEVQTDAVCVLRRSWPGCVEMGDTANITDAQLLAFRNRFARLTIRRLTGGVPRQGMFQLNATRLGLFVRRSALVWVLIKLLARLRAVCHDVAWDFLFENVQSGPVEDIGTINEA